MSRPRSLSKVLLYSHDTYGLGHLRRNLVIARQLIGQGIRVVLASGSPVLDRVAQPEGLISVQLPPVVKTGPDEYRSLGTDISLSLVSRARSAVLADIIARWQPDVFLVDHAAQGMKGELLPVFDTIGDSSPGTKIVLGLRDILDEPALVRATWANHGVYETLNDVYDRIVVYGDRDVFDLVAGYGIPEPLASSIEYCGYVTGHRPGHSIRPPGLSDGVGYVLGTVGGGGDGVDVLIATAHAARSAGLQAVLCSGPLMGGSDRRFLAEATDRMGGVVVVEHLQDVAAVAAGAECVVTRGGYNSLCELVNLAVPTVVVPRVWPRREQLLRARAFAGRGLVRLVEASRAGESGEDGRQGGSCEGLDSSVARAVADAINSAGGPRADLDLGGAQRVVASLVRALDTTNAPRLTTSQTLTSRIPA